MTFSREGCEKILPGQFLSIRQKAGERILRRPFSIFGFDDKSVSVLIKAIGRGTESITDMNEGESADILCPLGKGFEEKIDYDRTLFVAGGIGIAGINSFIAKGKKAKLIFGDREGEFSAAADYFSIDCLYVSEKGKNPNRGRVTEFIDGFEFDAIIACGPKAMLRAVKEKANGRRYLAVCEEIMACGVGLCNGCAVKYDDNTFKKVCIDGPVLDGNRIIYD